jgi:hypothetical protein
MALTYNISETEAAARWNDRDQNNATDMIWATMFTGINRITEKNAGEVAYRMWVGYQFRMLTPINYVPDDEEITVENGFRMPDKAEVYERVRMFIGLHTNAESLTEAAWWGKIRRMTTTYEKQQFTRMHREHEEKVAA